MRAAHCRRVRFRGSATPAAPRHPRKHWQSQCHPVVTTPVPPCRYDPQALLSFPHVPEASLRTPAAFFFQTPPV